MTESPVVGIVTRTKNRPVLLKRAVESVLFQTYRNWEMVIVNDGGDPAPVENLLARYADDANGRIRIVHNPASLGMEGASKVGLAALDTELLVVHDDDDSWAPEFLVVTVTELRRMHAAYPTVHGVTTYAHRVLERIQGNLVEIESIAPFNDWVPPGFLSLDRMLMANFIPPVSFLFTRAAYEGVGGVYEAIPYLGDWDFLVRFLSKYEIVMVPQLLAFYHWRIGADTSAMGNSIIGELDRHRFYRQMLLNEWLRRDLAAGRFGVGAYANLRSHLGTLIDQSEHLVGLAEKGRDGAEHDDAGRKTVDPGAAEPRTNGVKPASR